MAERPDIEGYEDPVRIARGGFAVVYRARQTRFDRVVALKVLSIDDVDDRARSRFERECRVMGSLSWHPNVVAVLDSGIADGHPWLAMQLLEAGSLADRLERQGPLPWAEVVDIGIQVAGALGAAHASGVLHRDLKPENLLVGPFGEAKLADFGIAAVEGGTRTTTGHSSFTVAHVAPEILEGRPPDERSDVYGLASTLHTLIGGSPPFTGERDESIAALITRVLHTPAPRLEGVPASLADLLQQGLAKDPADRPAGAEALGRGLQAVQAAAGLPETALRLAPTHASAAMEADAAAATVAQDATVAPQPAGPTAPAVAQPTVAHTPPGAVTPPPAPSEPPRRRRPLAVLAAVVAALLAVAVVVVVLGSGDDGGSSGTPEVTATIAVGASPRDLALTDDTVWVTTYDDDTVARIDRSSDEVSPTTAADHGPQGIAAHGGRVWVGNYSDGTLTELDAATGEPVTTLAVDASVQDVGFAGDDVWAVLLETGAQRVNATTGDRSDPVELPGGPFGIAVTEDAVWVTSIVDDAVSRIDPSDLRVLATVEAPDGSGPTGVAATDEAVWVANSSDGTVMRIDPERNEIVDTIDVGHAPTAVALTDGAVWVTVAGDDEVVRVDPEAGEVTDRIPVGANPLGIAADEETVWVANEADGTVSRIDIA